MSKRVILDIDAGTDDAYALILLLEKKDVDIVAITCVNGNTHLHHVYNNLQRILKLCNRTEILVYLGAAEPLLSSADDNKNFFHGVDGFGDLEYEDDNVTVKPKKDCRKGFEKTKSKCENTAVDMMNKIVAENPNEITLICLGPLTNVALATKVHSGFAENVKEIYIMGGNHKGVGNITSSAEFNFYVDPESAYIVLHFSKCPITILPWEPCRESTIIYDWRCNVLGKVNHPTIDLLNAAEKSIHPEVEKMWWPCDAYLAALFLHPEVVKNSFKCKVSVELQGLKTRGQMVIMYNGKALESNVSIVTEIDFELFKAILLNSFNK